MNRLGQISDAESGAALDVISVIRSIDRGHPDDTLSSLLLRAQTPAEVASVLRAHVPALAGARVL